MWSADVVYVVLLLVALPIGYKVKLIQRYQEKQLVSTAIGVVMVLLVGGYQIIYSAICIVVNCLLIKTLGPKLCHTASFVWCFAYIFFLRIAPYIGLPPVLQHVNAVQLLLTLKLVGLAFEIHDSHELDEKIASTKDETDRKCLELQRDFISVQPSLKDMLCYSYCYIGILTGPYYKYRIYLDWLNQNNTSHINTFDHFMDKLKWLPVYISVFLVCSQFASVDYMRSDEFYEHSFWYKYFYMVPMFTVVRMRFYFAWCISECICVVAAFGAYPTISLPQIVKGPTDFKAFQNTRKMAPKAVDYSFETIKILNTRETEFGTSVRSGMRNWNMTVQYWFASFVYKKLPLKNSIAKAVATLVASAFWHGIHPGYYIGFLGIIPYIMADELIVKSFVKEKSERQQKTVNWLRCLLTRHAYTYMSSAFILLSIHNIFRYWSSIYFVAHLLPAVLIVIGYLCLPKKRAHSNHDVGDIKKST